LRVAIVGYGLAGRVFHGPLIAATPGLRVDAIVTANPERQAEARRDFPDAVVLPAPENLWSSRDGYDLAVIATASGSHVTVAAAAIDAGIAVVVEKPIATSAPSARSLAEHASARDVLLVPDRPGALAPAPAAHVLDDSYAALFDARRGRAVMRTWAHDRQRKCSRLVLSRR